MKKLLLLVALVTQVIVSDEQEIRASLPHTVNTNPNKIAVNIWDQQEIKMVPGEEGEKIIFTNGL